MSILFPILAALAVSLISLVGIFFYFERLFKIIFYLVSFSAGALLGGAFFHLLPEVNELAKNNLMMISVYILSGFILFFILEKFLWHHCHDKKQICKHHIGYMNLYGDLAHNFLDGIAIGSAFFIDFNLGVTTSIIIALHEIPQEFGDMAILLHFGFKKTKAIFFNFVVSLSAIIGAIIGFYASLYIDNLKVALMSLTIGGFIYIASADLIPELHKEKNPKISFLLLLSFIFGVIILYAAKILFD